MKSKFGKSYNRRHSLVSSSPRSTPAHPSSAFDPSLLNDQTEVDTVVSSNITDCETLSVPPPSVIDSGTNTASNKKVGKTLFAFTFGTVKFITCKYIFYPELLYAICKTYIRDTF